MRCRVVALRSSLRRVFVFGLCLALLPLADVPLLVRGRTQMPNQPLGHLRRGKPAGALPDLEDIQRESQIEREAPPPIPSTVRSPKLPLKPWDGRRVGDPFEQPPGQHSIAEKVGRPSRLGARMRVRMRVRDSVRRRYWTISLCRTSSAWAWRAILRVTKQLTGMINCAWPMRRARRP